MPQAPYGFLVSPFHRNCRCIYEIIHRNSIEILYGFLVSPFHRNCRCIYEIIHRNSIEILSKWSLSLYTLSLGSQVPSVVLHPIFHPCQALVPRGSDIEKNQYLVQNQYF